MSLILNIDTSTSVASISLAKDGEVFRSGVNSIQKDHAAFLHVSLKEMLQNEKLKIEQLSAIAVTEGPGSYTGLRVGMAAAKGIAYAKDLPLITCSTLLCLAKAITIECNNEEAWICPMIDARRMEVFTAVYNEKLEPVIPPQAMVLNENSLIRCCNRKMIFTGNGCEKFKNIFQGSEAEFIPETDIRNALAKLSYEKYLISDFADLAYAEPTYIKEFQST